MSQTAASTLHIVGRFDDAFTGAERCVLELKNMIAGRRPVQMWSSVSPHPYYAQQGVRGIQAFSNQFPASGTLLVAGVHVAMGLWLKYARFERVILLYNLASHEHLFAVLQALREMTGCEPEVVFASRALQLSVGLPGRVVHSFIDLDPFLTTPDAADVPAASRPFTVGRVSRDVPEKHHAQDPSLYRMLAARGIRVRIMGGTCLAHALGDVEGVELLPAGAQNTADFYRSLDAFFYRTGPVAEAYGRVVIEAMASGLPVVAGYIGGYADLIRPGVSGWLVHTQEEAYDALMALVSQPVQARQMGLAGRHDVLLRHSQPANEALVHDWVLGWAG